LEAAKSRLQASCPTCAGDSRFCAGCAAAAAVLDRYAEANIPVDYWYRDMRDFVGDPQLAEHYARVADVAKTYDQGAKLCFAGSHGVGKTMVCCCVLKRAVEKNYSALYTTLTDLVEALLSPDEDRRGVRSALLDVDFLCIDEFDPRFMASPAAADLFGRIVEPMIRHRVQNLLPLFVCTNSPNLLKAFSGPLQQSLGSLMNVVSTVAALGSDHRGRNEP